MTVYAQFRSWLKWLVKRQELEAGVKSELAFYIESTGPPAERDSAQRSDTASTD